MADGSRTALSSDDAIKAGAYLLGLIASAEHSDEADGGQSYGEDAIGHLAGMSHEGRHWLANILGVSGFQVGDSIAIEHGEPRAHEMVAVVLQRIIEHPGKVVTL